MRGYEVSSRVIKVEKIMPLGGESTNKSQNDGDFFSADIESVMYRMGARIKNQFGGMAFIDVVMETRMSCCAAVDFFCTNCF